MKVANSILKNAGQANRTQFIRQSILSSTESAAGQNKKDLSSSLTLTSLVDCFTVLVVFLLVATSVGGIEMATPKSMQLPKAVSSDSLTESAIVRIEANRYFLNNKLIGLEELPEALKEAKVEFTNMVIQADRRLVFSQLNPIVLSGLSAGYEKIQFAVLKGEKN